MSATDRKLNRLIFALIASFDDCHNAFTTAKEVVSLTLFVCEQDYSKKLWINVSEQISVRARFVERNDRLNFRMIWIRMFVILCEITLPYTACAFPVADQGTVMLNPLFLFEILVPPCKNMVLGGSSDHRRNPGV